MMARRRSFVAGVVSVLGVTLAGAAMLSAAPAGAAPPAAAATTADPATAGLTGAVAATGPTGMTSLTTSPCLTITRPPATTPSWAPGQVVRSWDGEDGTTSSWSAPQGITLTNTTAEAAGGTRSLRVDGVTVTSPVTFTDGWARHDGWFTVTAKVRLAPRTDGGTGQPVVVALRPRTTDATRAVPGTALVGADGWATVTASFRPEFGWSYAACFGGPDLFWINTKIELSRLPVCGEPPADLAVPVYVDDLEITTADGSTGGTPTPALTPTPIGPGPQTCPTTTTTTTSPPPPSTPQCTVSHRLDTQWSTGYVATLTVRNTSARALPVWTLRWQFPGGQKVVNLWGAQTWGQNDRTVAATSPPWQALPPGGTATIGFVGGGASAAAPLGATLESGACTVTAS